LSSQNQLEVQHALRAIENTADGHGRRGRPYRKERGMKVISFSAGLMLALALGCPQALAQFSDEQLQAAAPAGYKIANQQRTKDSILTEFIPEKQAVKNWTDMMTIQIFYGLKLSPDEFMAKTEQLAPQACPGAEVVLVRRGQENGYNFTLFLQECPRNPATRKTEVTWFKAIEGNDSFYVVQFATKYPPSKEKITGFMQTIRRAVVCDTRLPDRACGPIVGDAGNSAR
jgi:hypothetical protein